MIKNNLQTRELGRNAILKTILEISEGNEFYYTASAISRIVPDDESYGKVHDPDVREILTPLADQGLINRITLSSNPNINEATRYELQNGYRVDPSKKDELSKLVSS
jgi:hypothetical protein|tara:strand:- start:177 stop:497 length:321 start_codon:yes stop_codon:yes gene_type:complete